MAKLEESPLDREAAEMEATVYYTQEMFYNKETEGVKLMDTDLELINAFKGGDQSSFEMLTKKYQDRIYRLAYSMVHSAQEADDITQETFLNVYFKINSFRGQSSFFTWLYSIALNECRHNLRKRKKVFVSLDTPLSDEDTTKLVDILQSNERSPETCAMQNEQIKLANRLIDSLPGKYKSAYILRNVDGLSYNEIAEILNISVNKVKIWLFRAREKLDEIIKPFHETTGEGSL